jgi:hypothetical protein
MLEAVTFLQAFVYQVITINSTQPCFLNMTAGPDMWQNCGYGTDYIKAALLPWMWITGGYFSALFAAVLIIAVYIKYQKWTFSMLVGIIFMPFVYALFPTQFINFALIIALLGGGLLVVHTLISQTTEQ